MRFNITSPVIFWLLMPFVPIATGANDSQRATDVVTPAPILASTVEALLGCPRRDADILTPWQNLLIALPHKLDVNDENLRLLANALNDGPAPDAFMKICLPRTSLHNFDSSERNDHPWSYGKISVWGMLTRLLATKATHSKADIKAAQLFSRAALILAAQQDWSGGMGDIVGLTNDPDFVKLLNLRSEQQAAFQEFVKSIGNDARKCSGMNISVDDTIDALFEKRKTLASQKEFEGAIDSLRHYTTSPWQPWCHWWDRSQAAWTLLNVAKSQNNQEEIVAVEGLIHEWQAQLKDVDVKRWLDEAITDTAPPKRLIVHLVQDPKTGEIKEQ